jgi:hypothetical protein
VAGNREWKTRTNEASTFELCFTRNYLVVDIWKQDVNGAPGDLRGAATWVVTWARRRGTPHDRHRISNRIIESTDAFDREQRT